MKDRLIAIRYQFTADADKREPFHVTFDRVTSPFYSGERWAVRRGGSVLAVDLEWEHESLPSNRDDDFYRRYRFDSLIAAVAAYDNYQISSQTTPEQEQEKQK